MIEINNLTASSIDEEFLKKVAKKVLRGENKKKTELSIALVAEKEIKKLNKKYRRKNQATDVLSFGDGLNEIVICFKEVKRNAKKYNLIPEKELAKVLIHSILHLFGYEHSKLMQKKEEYYAKILYH